MSNSISTLLLRNLSDVIGENDPVRRRAAIDEIFHEDNAFAPESALGAGDAPIGSIIGPDFYQWAMSLRKAFDLPFREGMRLQFQADAFNVFNHAN